VFKQFESGKHFHTRNDRSGYPDDPIFFAGKDAQAIFRRRIHCDTSRTDRTEDAAGGKKRPSGGRAPFKIQVLYHGDAETVGGAFFRGRRDFHPASVNPSGFVSNTKADSRGLDSLGIEEKAESLVQALLLHPDTVVSHLEADEAVLL
jgi:hypothetical protein